LVCEGSVLRELRREAGLSCKDVGAALGISGTQVQKYEKGVNGLSLRRAAQFCVAFGCSMNELLSRLSRTGHPSAEIYVRAMRGKNTCDEDVAITRLSPEDQEMVRALLRRLATTPRREVRDE
jgi:transcriptional regulator with XRE-family HTH domain